MPTFYFTFGNGYRLRNNYVKIEADTRSQARTIMEQHHGMRWAFDYDEEAFEGQSEKFGLSEVALGTPNPAIGSLAEHLNEDKPVLNVMRLKVIGFLNTRSPNDWLEDTYMKVYVRQAYRVIEGTRMMTFDISNLEVMEEYRGKGHFSAFVQMVEQLLLSDFDLRGDIKGIYIENVQEERFRKKLERMGFLAISSSGWIPDVNDCFFSYLPIEFGVLARC